MGIDPATVGEFLEQRAIEFARGTVIDILDGSLMAQSGIAQAGEQAPVASKASHSGWASVVASPDASISSKALAMPLPS